MKQFKALLGISTVLWVIWGLVHILAGVMTMSLDVPAAFAGIADAVDPVLLNIEYHPAVGGVLGQHGFNLFCFGLVAVVGGVFIWRGSVTAVFVTALVAGLADLGYFLFLDLGGFVNFVPGTIMTLICLSAIVFSFTAYFKGKSQAVSV